MPSSQSVTLSTPVAFCTGSSRSKQLAYEMRNLRIRKLFVNPVRVKIKVKKDYICVPITESILRRI